MICRPPPTSCPMTWVAICIIKRNNVVAWVFEINGWYRFTGYGTTYIYITSKTEYNKLVNFKHIIIIHISQCWSRVIHFPDVVMWLRWRDTANPFNHVTFESQYHTYWCRVSFRGHVVGRNILTVYDTRGLFSTGKKVNTYGMLISRNDVKTIYKYNFIFLLEHVNDSSWKVYNMFWILSNHECICFS